MVGLFENQNREEKKLVGTSLGTIIQYVAYSWMCQWVFNDNWFNISSIAGRAVNTTISLLFLFKDCDVMNDW